MTWHLDADITASEAGIAVARYADSWTHHGGWPELVLQEATLRIVRRLENKLAEADPAWRSRTTLEFALTIRAAMQP